MVVEAICHHFLFRYQIYQILPLCCLTPISPFLRTLVRARKWSIGVVRVDYPIPRTYKVEHYLGFYLESSLIAINTSQKSQSQGLLLLGPFSGKPACQFIRAQAGRGVCADAFVSQKTALVSNVDVYPGHIACDGETKGEIVVPLMHEGRPIGVLDLDCLGVAGFDEDDQAWLEKIARIVVEACDWE